MVKFVKCRNVVEAPMLRYNTTRPSYGADRCVCIVYILCQW